MFDLGGIELLLIGIVALLVMGDDFPTMFRKAGQFTGKMRKMAREFSRAMEEAADDAGVKDVTNTLKTAANPKKMGLDTLDKATETFEKWEAGAGSKRTAAPKDGDPEAAAKTAELRAKAGAAMSKAAVAARDVAAEVVTDTAEAVGDGAPPRAPAKKPAAKKASGKKPATKKPAARKAPSKSATPKTATAKSAGKGA
ncbi:MAG: twin-arginine translocase subunit TatB [Pseudomonadota bacterium]